jgi:anhydro-N-acetylmuramic acid kinase
MRYIGLMSGTSADGIDAALVEIDASERIRLVDFISCPTRLHHRIHAFNQNVESIDLRELLRLEREVAEEFAQACQQLLQKNQLNAEDIDAIGSH